MEKKSGARARAAKKLAGFSALLEDKRHKEIVLFYSSLGKIVSFYGYKNQLFYLFYIFYILPILTNSQEPEPFFWPLGAGAARKIIPGAGADLEKIRSRS